MRLLKKEQMSFSENTKKKSKENIHFFGSCLVLKWIENVECVAACTKFYLFFLLRKIDEALGLFAEMLQF